MTLSCFKEIKIKLIENIMQTKKELRIAVAWLSYKLFNDAFIELIKKEVKITILCNDDFINDSIMKNIDSELSNSNLFNLKKVKMHSKNFRMHNKYCIIDDNCVITGSYNWSNNANNNFENIIIIKDDKKVIYEFLQDFNELETINEIYDNYKNIDLCDCRKKMVKIAVLDRYDKYDENFVNDVKLYNYCVSCDTANLIELYSYHFLESFLFPESDNDFEDENQYNKEQYEIEIINRQIEIYNSIKNLSIKEKIYFDAFAVLTTYNNHSFEDDLTNYYKIIWKNRYVKDIPDEIDYNVFN